VAFGKALVDVAADVYQAQALLRQQAKLIETRRRLEEQLYRLQGKDPEQQAQWSDLLKRLLGDPALENAAFKRWLEQQGISKQDLIAATLRNTGTSSAVVTLAAIDPVQNDICALLRIPGINPEFVRALNRERMFLQQGNLLAASAATFSDYHHHIMPFGGPAGTELRYGTSSGRGFLPKEFVTGPHPITDTRTGCNDTYKQPAAQTASIPVVDHATIALHWDGSDDAAINVSEDRYFNESTVDDAISRGKADIAGIPFLFSFSRDSYSYAPGERKSQPLRMDKREETEMLVWVMPYNEPHNEGCWKIRTGLGGFMPHFKIKVAVGRTTDFSPPVGRLVLRGRGYVSATLMDPRYKFGSDGMVGVAECMIRDGHSEAAGDWVAGEYVVRLWSGGGNAVNVPVTIRAGEITTVSSPFNR
jgi:hypothetical protein